MCVTSQSASLRGRYDRFMDVVTDNYTQSDMTPGSISAVYEAPQVIKPKPAVVTTSVITPMRTVAERV